MELKSKMDTKKIFFDSNGEKICGMITVPDDLSIKYPLVILCHGFTSSKDSDTYSYLRAELSKKGVLSLVIDFSGHGESGGKFEDITITKGYKNILSAIDYVKNMSYITKIALFGTSFGGVCALIAASRVGDIAALGMKSPAADMKENRKQKLGEEGFREWKKKGFAIFTDNAGKKVKLNYSFIEDAKNVDAFAEAKKISCLTLIIHGDNDISVPIQQSRKLAKIIKDARLEVINGANHYFDRPEEKERVNSMFVEFFKEVLK